MKIMTWIYSFLLFIFLIPYTLSGSICQSKINDQKRVCYWIETTAASFEGSQQACAAHGGNLATVDSAKTAQFIKDFVDAIGLVSGCNV